MGMENDALLSYLEDDARFADLFNCFCFGGMQVVKPQELREASEVYTAAPDGKDRKGGKDGQRIRDIKRRLESGGWLKILAVEAQRDVSYCMPWRIMEYDCREYGQQVQQIQRRNHAAEEAGEKHVYANAGERLGRLRREDRIAPVYTLCLYHGVEEWDGPRCLRDMVDFGTAGSEEAQGEWEKWFADYPMRLVCANEAADCTGFRTSLGIVFALLPLRKDKAGLRRLLEEDAAYRKMDEETARTVGVLMGVKRFMEHQEKYKEGEGYNMCQAIKEMMEDSRMEGEKSGWEKGEKSGRKKEQAEGIRIFIQSNRDDGTEEDAIAGKLQKYYEMTETDAWKMLNGGRI